MAGTPLRQGTGQGAGMHASHRHTDAYMAQMYSALEDMGVDTSDDPYKDAFDPACTTLGAHPGMAASQRGSEAPLPSGMAGGSRLAADAAIMMLPSSGWASGPADGGNGRMANVSDRPLLCMSVHNNQCVVGSADHGLIELSLGASRDGKLAKVRTLYSKQYGHTEWVTDVSHCPDGRVLSAGMDSKLCLWSATGVKCIDLLGHTGSVSKCLASADNTLALSAGYDKTLRLWSLTNGREVQKLRCHRAPVMHLSWTSGVMASADRDGSVVSWDPTTGDATHLGAHGGHCTALAAVSYSEPGGGAVDANSSGAGLLPRGLVSGGHDGIVRLWDLRSKSSAMETRVHEGAVNDIIAHKMPDGSPTILTSGADRRVLALDPRMSLQCVHLIEDQRDFVYSLTAIGHLVVSGGGDGTVLVHDLNDGSLLYGLSGNAAAVRAMHADTARLVCAGDDGGVISFDFDGVAGGKPRKSNGSLAVNRASRLGPMNPAFAAGPRSADGSDVGDLNAGGHAGRGGERMAELRDLLESGLISQEEFDAKAEKLAGAGQPLSAAQAYADKKRLAMEKADRNKAERRAKQQAERNQQRPEWDDGGTCGGTVSTPNAIPRNEFGAPLYPPGHPLGLPMPGGGGGAGGPSKAESELEMLHSMGDRKFGRGRR